MNKKRYILLSTACVVLLGLILLVGTAMANAPSCGTSDFVTGSNGLLVKKDVFCEFSRSWNWKIIKSADQSSLTLSTGQQAFVNYTVTASAIADGTYVAGGNISIRNTTTGPITVDTVVDSLVQQVSCEVTFPYTLAAGEVVHCTYNSSLSSPAPENKVTVTDSDGVVVEAVAPIDWSQATVTSETDECAEVSDTFAGTLGTVCAGQETSFTFKYTRLISFATCGQYKVENIASFLTKDSGSTGSSSWTVDVNVPCAGGCSLTPGYWKTHSSYGPAPYDDTWVQVGENTTFFLSGKSYYDVLWTSPNGNAYYILAHAYIAAGLNDLNGADFSAAQAAFDTATGLFNTYTPAQIAALRGNSALRAQFISLASTLDNYNNGLIGPGHCSE